LQTENRGGARHPPGRPRSFPGDARAGAADAIDGTVVIIGDEQRPVFHGKDVHRTSNVVVVLYEAGNEGFHRPECAIAVQSDGDYIAADLHAAVPGSVPRKEHHVAIFIAQPVARVELQAKRGRMGPEQGDGLRELAAGVPPTEFRIGEGALVAIGIAEIVLAGLGDSIELVLRHVLRQPIARIFGEVELLQRRMPVHSHDLADTVGIDLEALAIESDAIDLAVPLRRHADVAGNADLEVELLVRANGEVFPAVRLVLWQIAQDDGGLRRIVEVVLDLLDLGDLIKLGDVQRALVQGYAVRPMETGGNDLHLALAVFRDDGVQLVLHTARDENGSLVAEPQRACVGNAGRIDLDLEAGFSLQLVERQLVWRRRQRWRCDGCQIGIRYARRLTLLPRRWRFRRLLCLEPGGGRGDQKANQADRGREPCNRNACSLHDGRLPWMSIVSTGDHAHADALLQLTPGARPRPALDEPSTPPHPSAKVTSRDLSPKGRGA